MLPELDYGTLDNTKFDEIADSLMNNHVLIIGKKRFRIAEIEFYLKSDLHNDQYTHSNDDQMVSNVFYFHKFKTGTYKGGTFKGMDISMGDGDTKTFFGILIRSIYHIKSDTLIEGPCKVVDKILELNKSDHLNNFTGGKLLSIYDNEHDFILRKKKDLDQCELYYGPRIGLSNKYPDYQKLNYRYTIFPKMIKKQKSTFKEVAY
jgi:hypothetical protein